MGRYGGCYFSQTGPRHSFRDASKSWTCMFRNTHCILYNFQVGMWTNTFTSKSGKCMFQKSTLYLTPLVSFYVANRMLLLSVGCSFCLLGACLVSIWRWPSATLFLITISFCFVLSIGCYSCQLADPFACWVLASSLFEGGLRPPYF